jgi:dipeptidyl aminopeptidase/acylaminoacyl peptidase
MPKVLPSLFIFLVLSCFTAAFANPEIEYRRPSPQIADLVERPWLPLYQVDPTKKRLMKLEAVSLTPMEILARDEVNLAGLSIHTESRARSGRLYASKLGLVDIASGKSNDELGLPETPVILHVQWSPDGKYIGTLLETEDQVELWLVDLLTSTSKKLSDLSIHAGMDYMMAWSSDSQSVWVKTIPEDQGPPPETSSAPGGVVIRQSSLDPLPVQTHQGVLRTQLDVDKFEYFFSSRLTEVSLDGTHRFIGDPGIYRYFRSSPDNRYLLVERLVKPWSYYVNSDQFAYQVEVLDLDTEQSRIVASSPLAEDLPYGGGNVRRGARDFEWRSDVPSTVVWVEALDNGSPYENAKYRDQIVSLDAPFDEAPHVLIKLKDRVSDLIWHQTNRSIVLSWNWIDREIFMSLINPEEPEKDPRNLMSYKMGDRYRNPGLPFINFSELGFPILLSDESGDLMYLRGQGGSMDGDRPFLDRFNLETKRKKRLFHSRRPYLENPVTVLDTKSGELLVQRESKTEPPNYYQWNSRDKFHHQVTIDKNPYPELEKINRTLLRYKRKDGINLSANLYLPAGYNAKKDGPLPTLVWAYPKAYQNADNASQLHKSPYEFIRARWNRPIMWVTQGYAVVDDPAMPIIAEGRRDPNDFFIRQLVDSGDAIVRELVRRGISEEGKIALGGHSYGAFMTANLLAHSDSFCAGIARSGAYNRTLTPFGFQSEERNLWEALRVYLAMSPYLSANTINEPLLLLHGEKDANPGTFPLQSERLFHAMNGVGREARLVMFPNEAHTFRGKDSILHLLWEIERWLEIQVKKKPYTLPAVFSRDEASGNSLNSSGGSGAEDEPE